MEIRFKSETIFFIIIILSLLLLLLYSETKLLSVCGVITNHIN